MGMVTQSELAEKYGLKLPLLSTIMKKAGIKKIGLKMGKYKRLAAYDEQEATVAIIRHLNRRLTNEREEFNATKEIYNRVMTAARKSGILRDGI